MKDFRSCKIQRKIMLLFTGLQSHEGCQSNIQNIMSETGTYNISFRPIQTMTTLQ